MKTIDARCDAILCRDEHAAMPFRRLVRVKVFAGASTEPAIARLPSDFAEEFFRAALRYVIGKRHHITMIVCCGARTSRFALGCEAGAAK
ncbi:MAG: hypothetical protein WCD63_13850 [Terrimicrobiaceae bacterium]